jgi:hypothetical protein
MFSVVRFLVGLAVASVVATSASASDSEDGSGLSIVFLAYVYQEQIAKTQDSDGDGVLDIDDAFINDPNEFEDTDGDGIGNNADTDDDGDGVSDGYDYQPLEAGVWENPYEILSADALNNAPVGIVPDVVVSNDRDAIRLLLQATYGPRPEDYRNFQSLGPEAWLEEQLSLPQTSWLDTYRKWSKYWAEQGRPNVSPDEETFWDITLNEKDQVRQRMILAWSELFVIATTSGLNGYREAAHSYLDTLGAHTFGNFRDLLEAVTKHAAMGPIPQYAGKSEGEYGA